MDRALILDTEVTDLNSPAIVEAAYSFSSMEGGELQHSSIVTGRFNPGKRISAGASAVHGIADEDVAACPPASSLVLPDHQYLVGHNVDFDWKVVGRPDVRRICTLALSRHLWPAESHSLAAMIWLLEPTATARELTRGAHGAAADVLMVQVLLGHILDRLPVAVVSLEELWEVSEQARIPTHWPMGKFRGMRIDETPDDYLQWMQRQPDLDPYLAKAIEQALQTSALPF